VSDRNRLELVGIAFGRANAFVVAHHRHSERSQGHLFSLAAVRRSRTVGIVMVSKPRARRARPGLTAEVVRLCTVEGDNTCSFLYGAAVRSVWADPEYNRVITYTLASEPGTSLIAAGFERDGDVDAESWSREGRPRTDKHAIEPRVRWSVIRPGVRAVREAA
jgi:hypothetical protein